MKLCRGAEGMNGCMVERILQRRLTGGESGDAGSRRQESARQAERAVLNGE